MSAAIYYHPEAYSTDGPKLMGRNAAGESFLRGFLRHSTSSEFCAQVQKPEHGQQFLQTVRSHDRQEPVSIVEKHNLGGLARHGNVYFPGPGIGLYARHRSITGQPQGSNPHAAWSLCGISHTTSSHGAMDSIAELITAPVQPWDSLICTSNAVKDNIQRVLQAQVNSLRERLGITKLILPLMPVIPLGIHTEDFVFSEAQKSKARLELGADENTLVVLYMGRLSFHAKAHPLAMYSALEIASRAISAKGKKLMLIECGWYANDFIQKAYLEAAKKICPSVRAISLDGRTATNRQQAWAGADVFCSLSDNIQESFGITPIEAMAAGLPLVVSDWDGYKDTVRHLVDGFRIPTCMPKAGLGVDLAYRHALEIDNYDMYCGHACSFVSVDIDAAAQAFIQLVESPELRKELSQNARVRAKNTFDWSSVIKQYETLWEEQDHLRMDAQKISSAQTKIHHLENWPARMDPFYAFAQYPTNTLEESSILVPVEKQLEHSMEKVRLLMSLAMVNFSKAVLPSNEEILKVLHLTDKGAFTAKLIVQNFESNRQGHIFKSLVWLLKIGVLRLAKPP
jgi:starch synthase